jgi:hypothetical protein
MRRSP